MKTLDVIGIANAMLVDEGLVWELDQIELSVLGDIASEVGIYGGEAVRDWGRSIAWNVRNNLTDPCDLARNAEDEDKRTLELLISDDGEQWRIADVRASWVKDHFTDAKVERIERIEGHGDHDGIKAVWVSPTVVHKIAC